MLMKLLLMRIVANNVRGFSFSFSKRLLFEDSSSSRLCRSLGLNEKKATSEPEINADNKTRKARNKNDINIPESKERRLKEAYKSSDRGGSLSKFYSFVTDDFQLLSEREIIIGFW